MIQKASDITLKVLPLICTCEHLYYYEGPCRFGQGEALIPGYDRLANAQKAEEFLANIKKCAPEGIEIMEAAHIGRTDDWDNKEENWERVAPAAREADFVIALCNIGSDDLVHEFAMRFKKPIALTPLSSLSQIIETAALGSKIVNKYEVYAFYKWADLGRQMRILRARKVIQNTRILCVNRYGSNVSQSSVDAFNMHDLITDRLGTKFRFVSVFEFFDCMEPATEEGNHTTPGRVMPNITEEEIAQAEALCKELAEGAIDCNMPLEKMLPSAKAFILTRKLMDWRDCNGFTMPCPDACSTRNLNQKQFTMCLTHALNMEDGIPSSCEYDTCAVLSQQALIAISGKSPYMGNTAPVSCVDGKISTRYVSSEKIAELEKAPYAENLYFTHHSVAHRNITNSGKKDPYLIRNFAYDQGFGVTIRHDFDLEEGQKITLCRFSPDGSKLFVGAGEIVCGGGYDYQNCTQKVMYKVRDQKDFFKKQCLVGNHLSLVYGDYVEDLKDLAEALGIEAVVAD